MFFSLLFVVIKYSKQKLIEGIGGLFQLTLQGITVGMCQYPTEFTKSTGYSKTLVTGVYVIPNMGADKNGKYF